MNETRVFAVDESTANALEQRLRAGLPSDAEWRTVEHARFAVKAMGVSLVCYRSGKLVVQGKDVGAICDRFLGGCEPTTAKGSSRIDFQTPTIGSDEAGKGDYFGPLVTAAVFAEPSRAGELMAMGVADSKTLSDRRMFPLAERIERTFPCAVRTLMPEEYNSCWEADPNVNHLLANQHADALASLLVDHPGATLLVDRFADEEVLAQRLEQKTGGRSWHLVQMPRAEAHPVVAAASIVARVHFLEGFKACEEAAGTDLHKGAGAPVDEAAARAFSIGGRTLLARIAKLHFRNTHRVTGMRP